MANKPRVSGSTGASAKPKTNKGGRPRKYAAGSEEERLSRWIRRPGYDPRKTATTGKRATKRLLAAQAGERERPIEEESNDESESSDAQEAAQDEDEEQRDKNLDERGSCSQSADMDSPGRARRDGLREASRGISEDGGWLASSSGQRDGPERENILEPDITPDTGNIINENDLPPQSPPPPPARDHTLSGRVELSTSLLARHVNTESSVPTPKPPNSVIFEQLALAMGRSAIWMYPGS